MPDLKLYTLVVPLSSQDDVGSSRREQLARSGILDGDLASTASLGTERDDRTLSGVYKGRYAGKQAAELEELGKASGFDPLPLTGLDSETSADGYYTIEDASAGPARAQDDRVQEFDLALAKRGTKQSHFRVVHTNRETIDNPFGSDREALVGIPADARKAQWVDLDRGDREVASPTETRAAELGDVDVYDLDDADLETDSPSLVYHVDYGLEEDLDCRVYDTRDFESKHDSDDNLRWQKAFATDHDAGVEVVLDTGLLRLRLDESDGSLRAQEWSNGSWSTISLPSTSWEVFDVDLIRVSMARIDAQLTFVDGSSLYALDASLQRGRERVEFAVPRNESDSLPSGLDDWLDPIASPSEIDVQPRKDLVRKQTVRK
ncbi:MAG: hypothetical protein ACOCZD_02195 [Haloferacaceae archaeon]